MSAAEYRRSAIPFRPPMTTSAMSLRICSAQRLVSLLPWRDLVKPSLMPRISCAARSRLPSTRSVWTGIWRSIESGGSRLRLLREKKTYDKIKINKNDSYESCKKRMESKNNLSEYTANYVEELDKLSRLSWLFVSPEKEEKFKFPKGDFKKFILQF